MPPIRLQSPKAQQLSVQLRTRLTKAWVKRHQTIFIAQQEQAQTQSFFAPTEHKGA